MTHEFKQMLEAYLLGQSKGLSSVMATVVDLDGSSYRKPGVRMLILEDETMIGAVSGGCVEKEIIRQSKTVFSTGIPNMITYDGRFRLGCEGVIYILIEPFRPTQQVVEALGHTFHDRKPFQLQSQYRKVEGEFSGMGTQVILQDEHYALGGDDLDLANASLTAFEQQMPPCFRLLLFGGEHDAVQLSSIAGQMGWEVSVVVGAADHKTHAHFPGATHFIAQEPEQLNWGKLDDQTAVIIMTHSFSRDLKCLMSLIETKPAYIGMLGPAHKREQMLDRLLEYHPEVSLSFIERVHGPAGLDIGSETPQEIAVSIIAEMLAVTRNRSVISLRDKTGNIHS